jgi:hypothetical protein
MRAILDSDPQNYKIRKICVVLNYSVVIVTEVVGNEYSPFLSLKHGETKPFLTIKMSMMGAGWVLIFWKAAA